MNVQLEGTQLKHNPTPRYLGVDFDRSLTYEARIRRTCKKLKTRTNLIQRISGVGWGADANTLRTAVMGLVIAPAEYCCQSFIGSTHVTKIDVQINCAWLPVMANIALPKQNIISFE